MTNRILLVVLLLLIGYGCVEAWPLVAGPGLSITSPEDTATVPGGVVTVEGSAPRAAELTLNGAPLLRNQDGSFVSTRTFPRGGSLLTFVAADRFGRTVTATRSIFVPN